MGCVWGVMPSDKEILMRDETSREFHALHEIVHKHYRDRQKNGMKKRRNKREKPHEELLPPLVIGSSLHGDCRTVRVPVSESAALIQLAKDEDSPPLVFCMRDGHTEDAQLHVSVKILRLECCWRRVVWCFSTSGMCSVGQDELIFLMEHLPTDTRIPVELLQLFNIIFEQACSGNRVSHMGFTQLGEGTFLGSEKHAGFLYVKPARQCVRHLLLPAPPHVPLFMVLVDREEIPWLRNLPLRLLLRLGLEEGDYPCSLLNRRFRPPVYTAAICDTIATTVCDFDKFQYQFPYISGLKIHIEANNRLTVLIPKSKHYLMCTLASVYKQRFNGLLPLAADFSLQAHAHLTASQVDRKYVTGVITSVSHNKMSASHNTVTGASFIIFGGHPEQHYVRATSSLVEDGILVNMTSEIMTQLCGAVTRMEDYTLVCDDFVQIPKLNVHSGKTINIKWVEQSDYLSELMADDVNMNSQITTPLETLETMMHV